MIRRLWRCPLERWAWLAQLAGRPFGWCVVRPSAHPRPASLPARALAAPGSWHRCFRGPRCRSALRWLPATADCPDGGPRTLVLRPAPARPTRSEPGLVPRTAEVRAAVRAQRALAALVPSAGLWPGNAGPSGPGPWLALANRVPVRSLARRTLGQEPAPSLPGSVSRPRFGTCLS